MMKMLTIWRYDDVAWWRTWWRHDSAAAVVVVVVVVVVTAAVGVRSNNDELTIAPDLLPMWSFIYCVITADWPQPARLSLASRSFTSSSHRCYSRDNQSHSHARLKRFSHRTVTWGWQRHCVLIATWLHGCKYNLMPMSHVSWSGTIVIIILQLV